jgi:hypothetical protein
VRAGRFLHDTLMAEVKAVVMRCEQWMQSTLCPLPKTSAAMEPVVQKWLASLDSAPASYVCCSSKTPFSAHSVFLSQVRHPFIRSSTSGCQV